MDGFLMSTAPDFISEHTLNMINSFRYARDLFMVSPTYSNRRLFMSCSFNLSQAFEHDFAQAGLSVYPPAGGRTFERLFDSEMDTFLMESLLISFCAQMWRVKLSILILGFLILALSLTQLCVCFYKLHLLSKSQSTGSKGFPYLPPGCTNQTAQLGIYRAWHK
ncbi:hypothetical protein QNM99_18740 [Pseudomonas sp. PCH446]